jgi:uncharacterized membrane protein
MKAKMFVILMAFVLLSAVYASAVDLEITSIKVNGDTLQDVLTDPSPMSYDRGQALPIHVCVQALSDVKDAQISVFIPGYTNAKDEPSKISDMTDTFSLKAPSSKCFDLSLEVPTLIQTGYFRIKVEADDKDSSTALKEYRLDISGINRRSAIEIKDFSLDPQEIIAGRAFTGKVNVKNLYGDTINDLKLTMSIPALNIQASEYMDQIDKDQSKTFEELLLRIPECTKAGSYDVDIAVEFADFSKVETTGTINVKSGDTCGSTAPVNAAQNTVISVPNMQEVSQGTSIVYPVVINNNGATSQTYALSVTGASTWSTTRIDPSSVIVVPAGQSKTAYLYVSTNDNAELGDKVFTLSIDSGSDTKSVPLVAKITKSTTSDMSAFKNALQIGLVVLVVILIIVGLIIGFNKMKDNKNEAEPYY